MNPRPFSEAGFHEAADWLTLFMSGEATDEDRRRWRRWLAAEPEHEQAWRHIETVTARLKSVQAEAAHRSLATVARKGGSRRKAVRGLLGLGVAGVAGLLASRTPIAQQALADYRSGTGELRSVRLDDGTRLLLNTATALDVRFDGAQRLVRLRAGEVLVDSGHAPGEQRPLIVQTAQGRVQALGTRFTVRQLEGGRTEVAVFESAVAVTPAERAGLPQRLQAGMRARFNELGVDAPTALADDGPAWARRQLMADDLRLDDFLAELARYRPGLVRCDPAVAGLRLSGVFQLTDTDRILDTLPGVLPVRLRWRTRYWVTVEAAA